MTHEQTASHQLHKAALVPRGHGHGPKQPPPPGARYRAWGSQGTVGICTFVGPGGPRRLTRVNGTAGRKTHEMEQKGRGDPEIWPWIRHPGQRAKKSLMIHRLGGFSATRTSAPTHDQQMRRRGLPSHARPRPGGPLSFQPVADDPMRGRHPCGTVFPAPQAGLLPPRG